MVAEAAMVDLLSGWSPTKGPTLNHRSWKEDHALNIGWSSMIGYRCWVIRIHEYVSITDTIPVFSHSLLMKYRVRFELGTQLNVLLLKKILIVRNIFISLKIDDHIVNQLTTWRDLNWCWYPHLYHSNESDDLIPNTDDTAWFETLSM